MTARDHYLSMGTDKLKNDKYVAGITLGHPHSSGSTVLSVTEVSNFKEAKKWYKEQMRLKPWIVRN